MSGQRRARSRHAGRALAASAGIVIGRVQRLTHGRQPIPERQLADDQLECEVARLDRAVEAALAEMRTERDQLAGGGGGEPQLSP